MLTECSTPFERLKADVDACLFVEGSSTRQPRRAEMERSPIYSRLSKSLSSTDARRTPQEWVQFSARALSAGHQPDAANAARLEAESALNLQVHLAKIGSTFRLVNDMDGARRIAERMLALADHYRSTCADLPAAHLALTKAYEQMWKNARQAGDDVAVEANVKRALSAARQAWSLDPDYEFAERTVRMLEQKLARLQKG